MKRLLIALALTFALTASAQTAVDKIAEGRAALVAHNMPAAKAAFAQAVTLDGGNQTARALLGITQLFDVTSKAGSDAFLDGLGLGEAGRDVYRWDVPLPRDGNGDPVLPTDYNFTTVANYWLTTLVPESESARANLKVVTDVEILEPDPNFLLTLSTAETKMPMSITLDTADLLMAQACLRAAEFLAHLGSGQNLDANLEDILEVAKGDMLTLQRIINANPNFLTAGSSSERLAAKQALQDMIALYRTAATALRARPAGVQRLFMLEPADFAAEAEFQFMLDRLEQSITAPVDLDGAIVYTAPLFDAAWSLRAQLPPFTATGFDVTTIPSATFGGVITGLSKESIAAMFSDTHDTVAEIGWEWVSPKPQGNTLGKYLALASGKHLAIGNAGTYLTSLNGTNWTANRIPGVGQLRAAVEHAGRIVMVTYDGSIFASDDDAVTWRRVFNDAGSGFHGVTYGGGKYVAVGDYGLIATSVDGESWSNFYPNGVSMLNVLHTGSLFVAVGVDETNGNIVINTSPDGMAWTTRVNAFHSYAALWGLAQNGSTLVAVGGDTASLSSSNKLAYSTDGGLSWTIGSLLASPTGNIGFNNVAYVNGKFVAVGTAATIATSTDGITWGTANSGETFLSLVGVGGNGSTTYVTSGGGVILSSTDNVTFTRPMSPPFSTAAMVTNPTFLSVKDIDGTLWAVGGNSSATGGVILKSTDGQTFSNTLSSNPQPDIWEIIKVGATYYAVGGLFANSTNYNAILTSNDGAAWTAQSMGGFTTPIRSIAYLNGQFITVGAGNSIRTSPDGVTWTQRTSGLAGGTFFGVAYGNGVYVAVGGVSNPGTNNFQSHVVTSTDGANWTVRFANTPNMFRGIVFQDGVFTAVGNNGEIRRSEDGINWWHANDSDLQTNFLGISYLDGHYYVTAASGNATSTVFESQSAVLISSNGDEWVRVTLGTSNIPYRTALFQNRLYVAASGASIIRSQTLTPVAPPIAAIVTPAGGTSNVPQGTSLTLTANVTSDGATSYQWFKGGVEIPDATGPGLTLDNVQAGDAGSYTVVVTNAAGSDTSDPIVVSVNATAVAPKILFHPESQTLNVGFNVTLSVEATGTAPLTYVWKKDGVVVTDGGNISGATTPELSISSLTAANGGSYTVEVSNGTAPTAVSLPAILTVDSNPAYNFTIMAGSPGLSGTTDATGWGARFDNPQGIAVDGSGNVYVTSPSAQTIRKVTSGNVVTTVAGSATVSGYLDDIVGTAARFNGPRGLALNAAGTMLYVADTNNGKIRRVDLSTNTVTTWATGLNSPLALVLDAAGNAYVASWDHTIRKISPDGLTITLIAGATYAAGSANNTTGTSARFNNPMAIAIDPAGANLYVADSANALIRKVSLTAPYAVTTYAGLNSVYGYADGPALSGATFSNPMGVAVDPAGNVIVADNSSDTIRKISPNGFVRTIGGQPYWRGFNDGPGDQARFGGPTSIAADANGNLYLLENANHIVRRASASASPLLPVIQFSPHDQTVAVGEDVLFGVVATGVSTLSYQWQKDGVNLGGATNPTLPLTNVQSADAGRYRVLVTSTEGSALSAEAVLTVTVPPAITGQPAASLVVASGQPIALSVTTGDAGATYQWRRNGFEIPGAIGANLNLASATRQDAGYYDVVINGLNGAVVSAATDVRVAPNAYPGDLAFDASFSANPLLTLSTRIFAAIPLADGKWLVGGDFVQWDNAPRTFLARLNADYSLDETFTPPLINGFVNALAVAADGSVYVGGDFTAVDGHAMPGLFRLTPAFRLDLAWRPRDNPPKSSVTALAAMADGRLIVARATMMPDHAVLNGANVLRRLYADGTLDTAFSVTVGSTSGNPRVNAVAVEADGDVAFAGGFATVNGTSRPNLARVDASGVLDANFAYTGSGSGANNTVWSLTLLADGRYLVGGNFGQVAGTSRNRIAIVNADGTLDAFQAFTSGTNGNVLGVARQSDGKIIAAGTFTQANGQGTDGLVRLTSTGAVDLLFPSSNTGPSSSFNTVASPRAMFVFPQSNGSIALFGGFTGALHQSRIAVAVVAANGQLQAWPNANLYRPAYANSGYVLPGNQTAYFGSIDLAGSAGPLGQAVRVNDNGSLDVSFPQGTGYDLNYPSRFGIYRAVRQGDGKFLAVGDLAGYNGNWGYRMLRIGADGSFDGSFDAGSGPSAILPQVLALSGGKTLLYNLATGFTFNGTPIGRIARLNADGSVDFSFQTGPGFQNASAQSVAPNAAWEQPDGKIVVSGPFTTFNGSTANGLARLNPDGSLDATFSAGSGPVAPGGTAVISITGLPDGRLVIAGNLTTYNGAAANRVAVLQADGSLDASFNAPAGIDAAVAQVIAQEDGKFILYGDFGATATTSAHAMRVSATGVIDPTFHLRGITGAGAGSSRLMLGDDGSVYAYGGSPVSFNYGVPLAIARYRGAAAAPTIAADPVSASVTTGGTAVFAVRANGTGPFTYQWRRNGVDLPGENSSVLILDNIDGTDAAAYDVLVTGPTGATATSAGATLTVGSGAPVILDQPFGRRAVAGGKVLFRVGAGGTAPFTYQWRKNGVDIGGATGADLVLDPVGAGDAGTYSVAVTNAVTTTVSAGADLTVLTPDAVLWQQFTDMSTEHAPARLLLDGNGKVYVPWSVQDRNPDMAGGRLAGALARFDEATGAYDPAFALDRRYRGVSHGVLQPDGKLVLAVSAGDADTVIRVDGTGAVDPTFTAPLFARGIRFLTRQPDGRILVAAVDNLSVNAPAGSLGTSGPTLFRLEANGAVDAGFTPATLNPAGLLFGPPVVDASGRIYLAGGFGSVNGTPRTNIARLLANGTLDTGFAATLPGGWASTQARAVALQSDGRAVVVGDFRYGTRGTASDPIVAVRFNTDGTYDSGFAEPLRSYLGLAGLRLRHLEILGDDRILAVSDRFVRLLADGSPDATFQSPGLDREVFWFSRDASGRLYVADLAGVFGNAPATLLPAWGNGVARFLADGSPDFTFQTGGFGRSQYADSGRVLTNGDVIVAGAFNRFGSTRLAGVARFSAPDTLTAAQVAAPSGSPTNFAAAPYATVAAAAGDQTYVASVLNLNGTGSFYASLRRINADGTTDAGFNPTGLPSGYNLGSASLFAAPGGKLILAQATVSAQAALNGNTGDAMLRLNPDGTRDNGYTPGLSSFAVVERDGSNVVTMIRTGGLNVAQVLPDGRALIVVSSVDGTLKLQRLNADGTLDAGFTTPSFGAIVGASGFTGGTTYDPVKDVTAQFPITTYSASNLVRAAVQMPDGKVYVGGRFNLGGGAPRGLVRLNADGSLDGTFTGAGVAFSGTDAEPYVTALAVDATGRLYVAGRFTAFNGTALPGLFRLDVSGAIDTGWAPGFGVRDTPYAYASLVIANNRLHVLGTAGTGGDALPAPYRAVDLGSGLVAQTISFTGPADRPFTTDPITLTATATSGLPVTFTVQSGPASVTGSTLTLSGAGTVVVRASQAGNGTYAAAPDVDQSFVVGGSFSLWQASVFSEAELLDGTKTGPNTVYGQDGIPNLVKYALGLDPKVNATSGLPEVSTDATYWLFTYTRPADRADVTYTVQFSTNLTTWNDVPGGDHVRIATGSTETWRARYLLSGAANLFFRLKVTQ